MEESITAVQNPLVAITFEKNIDRKKKYLEAEPKALGVPSVRLCKSPNEQLKVAIPESKCCLCCCRLLRLDWVSFRSSACACSWPEVWALWRQTFLSSFRLYWWVNTAKTLDMTRELSNLVLRYSNGAEMPINYYSSFKTGGNSWKCGNSCTEPPSSNSEYSD